MYNMEMGSEDSRNWLKLSVLYVHIDTYGIKFMIFLFMDERYLLIAKPIGIDEFNTFTEPTTRV